MKYNIICVFLLNIFQITFCAQKDAQNPGVLLLTSMSRSDDQKILNEMQQFEIKFSSELEPQFKTAAKELWKNRDARKREIWRAHAKACKGPAARYLDPVFEEKYKAEFIQLFKDEYRKVFGEKQIPQHFQDLDQENPNERLQILATTEAYLFYEKKKYSWLNLFCGCIP